MSLIDRRLRVISKLETYDGPSQLSDGDGLVARISPLAIITFQYRCRFNGKQLRINIGKYPATSLKEARQKHKIMMEMRESGRNRELADTDEQDFVSFHSRINYWLNHYVPTLKKGTQELSRSFARSLLKGPPPNPD